MDRKEIEEKVVTIIADATEHPQEKISLDSSLRQDLAVDSLQMSQIAQDIEIAFDLHFNDEDQEQMKTVKDGVDYIEKELSGK